MSNEINRMLTRDVYAHKQRYIFGGVYELFELKLHRLFAEPNLTIIIMRATAVLHQYSVKPVL